jgi:UDP-glucose 4-epimerase
VLDVVHGIVLLLDEERARGGVYNIGATTETAIVELARRVIERTESDSKIQLVSYEEAYDEGFEELGRRKPDTTRLQDLTGWLPARTVDDAIDDVVAYERWTQQERGEAKRLRIAR